MPVTIVSAFPDSVVVRCQGYLPPGAPDRFHHLRTGHGTRIGGIEAYGSGRQPRPELPARLRRLPSDLATAFAAGERLSVTRVQTVDGDGQWRVAVEAARRGLDDVELPGTSLRLPGQVHRLFQLGATAMSMPCAGWTGPTDGKRWEQLQQRVIGTGPHWREGCCLTPEPPPAVAAPDRFRRDCVYRHTDGAWRLDGPRHAGLHYLGDALQAELGRHLTLYMRLGHETEPRPARRVAYVFAQSSQTLDNTYAHVRMMDVPHGLPVGLLCPNGWDVAGDLASIVGQGRLHQVYWQHGQGPFRLDMPEHHGGEPVWMREAEMVPIDGGMEDLVLSGPALESSRAGLPDGTDLFHPQGCAADGDLAYVAADNPQAVLVVVKRDQTYLSSVIQELLQTGLDISHVVVAGGRAHPADPSPRVHPQAVNPVLRWPQ
jgi:hypothetical protein